KLPGTFRRVMILGDHLKRAEMEAPPGEDDSSLGPWGPQVQIYDLEKKKFAVQFPEIKGYMVSQWRGTLAEAYMDPEAKKHAAEDAKAWDVTPESRQPSADKGAEKGTEKSKDGSYTGKTAVAPASGNPKEDLPPNTYRDNSDFHPDNSDKS